MIWALILVGGAVYGYTLLGTDQSYIGAILVCLPAVFWRSVYDGLGRFVWVGAGVVLVLFVIWLTSDTGAPLAEMQTEFTVMALFPAALLVGFLITKREHLSTAIRRLVRRLRS